MARKKKKTAAKKPRKQQNNTSGAQLSSDAKRSIAAIILFLIAFVSFLGFFDSAALIGQWLDKGLGFLFGFGKWFMPIFFLLIGFVLLKKQERGLFYVTNIIGFLLAFLSILGLLHMFFEPEKLKEIAEAGRGGGHVGYLLAMGLQKFMGMIAGVALLVAMLLTSLIVSFNFSIAPMIHNITDKMAGAKNAVAGAGSRKKDKKAKSADEDDEYMEDDDGAYDEYDEDELYDENGDVAQPTDTADMDADEDDYDLDGEEDILEKIPAANVPEADANIKNLSFGHERAKSQDEAAPVAEQTQAPKAPEEHTQLEDTEGTPKKRKKPSGSANWRVPPVTLMESAGNDRAEGGDKQRNQQVIQETYANFGITLEPADIVVGPTVTQYAFRPPAGVKLSRITALASDLALALAAHPIRIEAPIPGKSLIGIEVPNAKIASVRMQDVIRSKAFPYRKPGLKMALGKDVNGQYVIADLAKMPHVLVAGSTGAGKSVTVNAMIVSLLYQNTPEDLRMILVDPKRVELSLYNGIPHLLSEVIVENGKVLNALKWAVGEMERRYALLQQAGVRELGDYNQKCIDGELDPHEHQKLPAIVIVIDEMADLMASHGKEVEGVIVRIAQMARAVRMHLVLSTQRPSVEVLTGLIKANVPTRIALRVNSQIDSRTIIDRPGAESLVGRGDMLLLSPENPQPKRTQSVYVSDDEVNAVVGFLSQQEWPDDAEDGLEEVIESAQTSGTAHMMDFANEETIGGAGGADAGESTDALYNEAKQLVIQTKKASTSYLQRRFRIGYSRAARLIDELEDNGVIAPADGAKPRAILISADDADAGESVDKDQVPMV